jgi:hypothetical protein
MVNNQKVLDEIIFWENKVQQEPQLLELAFFKIFVKFEAFLLEAFQKYAIGEKSKNDILPERLLLFTTENQLRELISDGAKVYLDISIERMENLATHIFSNIDNPFFDTFNDAFFKPKFKEMKIIRNFIAHESPESIKNYKKVLSGYHFLANLSLVDFFQKQARYNQQQLSLYEIYTNLIKYHSEKIAKIR